MQNRILLIITIFFLIGCAEKKSGYNNEDAKKLMELLNEKKVQNMELSKSIGYEIEILEKNKSQAETEGLKEKFKTEIEFKKIAKQKLDFAIINEDSAIYKIRMELDTLK